MSFVINVDEGFANEARRIAEDFRRYSRDNIYCDFDWGSKVEVYTLLDKLASGKFISANQALDIITAISSLYNSFEKYEEARTTKEIGDFMIFHDSFAEELIFMKKKIQAEIENSEKMGYRRR